MSTPAQSRAWRQANPAKMLVYDSRRRARLKGVQHTITVADIEAQLANGWTCIYCSAPLGSYTGGQRRNSITLDRLIPADGYTPSNTVLSCHECNCSKAEHTPATFRAWADRIEAIIAYRQNPTE